MRQRSSYLKPFKAQVVQECLQLGATVPSVTIRHGINANVTRKWLLVYREQAATTLPAFLRSRGLCTFHPQSLAMIRINSIWLAREPMDMRAGTDTALACVVTVFGAIQIGNRPPDEFEALYEQSQAVVSVAA
ncbi:transposase [Halopseudomonas aestusnigri]|uniref:transposase n=1 Tax=Halopseudomonas aestusnigri TaxID=857252 RepID=UPI00357108E9